MVAIVAIVMVGAYIIQTIDHISDINMGSGRKMFTVAFSEHPVEQYMKSTVFMSMKSYIIMR